MNLWTHRVGRAVVVGAVAVGLSAQLAVAAPVANRLIVPGGGIGQLRLGRFGNEQLQKMPKAQASDAAMSQNRLVWVSPQSGNTVFVHTVSNGALDVQPVDDVTINEIRVSSPWFRTSQGIATGATLRQVRKAFPHLSRMARGNTVGSSIIYNDARKGIAFEFARGTESARCIGITVYIAGKKPESGSPVSLENVKNILHDGQG